MKSAFAARAAGSKDDKHRRSQTGLRDVLNVQPDAAAFAGRVAAADSRLRDVLLKKCV